MKNKESIRVKAPLAVTCTALSFIGSGGFIGSANASGFAMLEQSVKQAGNAISGGAAAAEDASTIFFNPAGLTRLRGKQVTAGAQYIVLSTKFKGSATTNPAFGATPISGGDGGDEDPSAFLPSFYYSQELNEQLWVGLGFGVPFGMDTEYDSDWMGRYHAIKTEAHITNFNPSLAYKVNNKLSLGAGLNYMQASAELTNAMDYSAICLGAAPPEACAAMGLATPGNPLTDGHFSVEGDDWGYGFNLGLLYEVNPKMRIGAAFRSKVKLELDGTADFTAPADIPIPMEISAVMADTDASSSVDLPASLSLSVTAEVAPKWDLMADVTWTQWSNFEELRIEFENPLKPDDVQPEEWNNTFKFSLGFNYRHNPKWTWRGGIAYDQTPVPSAELRTPRAPGSDKKWLAAGFTYAPSSAMEIDFALVHLFFSYTSMNATDILFGHNLTGTYDTDVNILSGQISWHF